MTNRKQRRAAEKAGTIPQTLPRATITLKNMPRTPFAMERPPTMSWTTLGRTDYELWTKVVMETLDHLGITRADVRLGFFLDFLNSLGLEVRKMLAVGLIDGLGMNVIEEKVEDDGVAGEEVTMQVSMDKKYSSLRPEEQRKSDVLWTPGDEPPPGMVQ